MSDLGDRFREYAALCDEHPGFVAAGVIARPNETIVTAFTESKDCGEKEVAIALYHGVIEPPIGLDSPAFRELKGKLRICEAARDAARADRDQSDAQLRRLGGY